MMHLVREMDMYVYCVTHPTVVYLDNAPRELTGMHGRRSENRRDILCTKRRGVR